MMNNFLKKYGKVVGSFLFSILFLIPNLSFADAQCSKDGYTIATINGINTNEAGARANMVALNKTLGLSYQNQNINYQYLYNPTHGPIADVIDSGAQKFYDNFSADINDSDLAAILTDASQKVTTQKLLLVAHSQGNFYANAFYNTVLDVSGGIPGQSIGVYGVATPADRVAGNGLYLTSDTDNVIDPISNILKPNIHISFQNNDDNGMGHDFSKIYLAYQGDRIVSDIKTSLNKLQNNNMQSENSLCINPPKLTLIQKIQGVALNIVDPVSIPVQTGVVNTAVAIYNAGAYVRDGAGNVGLALGSFLHNTSLAFGNMVGGLLANVASSVPSGNNLATGIAGLTDNTIIHPEASLTPQDGNEQNPPSPSQGEGPGVRSSEENNPIVVSSADDESSPNITTEPAPLLHARNSTSENQMVLAPVDSENSDSGSDGADDISNSGGNVGGQESSENNETESNVDTGTTIPDPLVCDAPKVLNRAGDACVDPVPVCTGAQTLVNNICIDPAPLPPSLITTTIDKDTTLLAGTYKYDNLVITNNAKLTLEGDPNSTDSFKGVKINAVNITVDSGSSISADGNGYGSNEGPGASSESSVGASYGGLSFNGSTYSTTYGSATKPADLGSGGTYYGAVVRGAGGAMRIIVSDTFTNNGTVSSDGFPSSSGGSIYVTAKNITGNGILRTNGGALYANGYFKSPGGGGRIAIYYKTSSFDGVVESKGGCGSYDGWSKTCAADGTVGLFDESNNNLYLNGSWKFLQADAPFNFNNIYISNGAKVTSENSVTIIANNIFVDKNSSFVLADNQVLNIPTITIDGGSMLTLSGSETINANNLTVTGNNSKVDIIPLKILSLNIPNINVGAGSFISADQKGYGLNAGKGAPPANNEYAGASYGGVGYQNILISVYGSELQPIDFGSGGNGYHAAGGGAIKMTVNGALINNGIISANGNNTSSGGSVYVTANTLDGTGVFQANSGDAYCPFFCYGPGGGGRIAIYYKASSFTGTEAASGWNGFSAIRGQDGTVHVVDESVASAPVLSSEKKITAFGFTNLMPNVSGVIDETNHTITATIPFETDVATLVPTITFSPKASISPSGSDAIPSFTNPVTYTVTAEDKSVQNYIVTVTVASDPNPIQNPVTLSITSYTLNGVADNVTANPLASPLSLVINTSENVNWMSIKIENQTNPSIYKIFQSGTGCSDGTNTCAKTWTGLLTKGGLLQNGTYRIKLHVKDTAGNEFYDYLSPYIINVNTSI
jgi:hypothetical protein